MDNQSSAAIAAAPKPLPFPLLAAVLGLMSMFGAISIDMYLPALPALEAVAPVEEAQALSASALTIRAMRSINGLRVN